MIKHPNYEKVKTYVRCLKIGDTFICENGVVGIVAHSDFADYDDNNIRKIYINLGTGEEICFDDISEWVIPMNFELVETKS